MNPILFSFIAGVVLNLALTPLAIKLCHQHDFLDQPGHRKIHDEAVPKLGGVAFMLAVLFTLAVYFLLFDSSRALGPGILKPLSILGVAFSLGVVGFLDDLYDLKPSLKLVFQLLITSCFVLFGYCFEFLHLPGFTPIGLPYPALPITALWMIGVIKGFNFMDGVDGLTGSVSAVIFLGLGFVSYSTGEPALQALSFAALGAILVFLGFNWRPAKIYLGNCGTNALGGLAAAFLVSSHKEAALFTQTTHSLVQPFLFQLFVSTLLVGYPFLEVALSTTHQGVKRFLFSRSMEWSEKEHIHHRLMKLGFKAPAISLTGFTLQLLFSSAGLLVLFEQRALALWILGPVFMVLAYAIPRLGFFDFLGRWIIRDHQAHYLIVQNFFFMQRAKLKLAVAREEILALLVQTCAELGVQEFSILLKGDCVDNLPFKYSWERPPDISRKYLSFIKTEIVSGKFDQFKDRITLEGDRGEADWIFEPHTEEGDLDEEYRVLVSDFMKEALGLICGLKSASPATERKVEIDQLSHAKARPGLLRRKHAKKNGIP